MEFPHLIALLAMALVSGILIGLVIADRGKKKQDKLLIQEIAGIRTAIAQNDVLPKPTHPVAQQVRAIVQGTKSKMLKYHQKQDALALQEARTLLSAYRIGQDLDSILVATEIAQKLREELKALKAQLN